MQGDEIVWPRKVGELHNHSLDSTIWNEFVFRDDDIVIGSYAKSGTTWVQQIVAQLLFNGDADVPLAAISPQVEFRVDAPAKLALLEAQTHRRFLKTHLPVHALRYSPRARYLYVARDGRDVAWSLHNHHLSANEIWYRVVNESPGRVGPPIGYPCPDTRRYFLDWLERDGFPLWPFWEHVRGWWQIRGLPNLMLLHFARLSADLAGEIRRIAGFLGIPIDEARFPRILAHCGFDHMKAHAERVVPLGGAAFHGGAQSFIHKGIDGRWRGTLTDEDCRRYEAAARRELGEEGARWLATGG